MDGVLKRSGKEGREKEKLSAEDRREREKSGGK